MRNIINALIYSGILWFGEIIPAPFLEDEFIEKFAPPEEVKEATKTSEETKEIKTAEKVEKTETAEKYRNKTPAREILESIVADVLKDLGFSVRTNERLRGKGGGEIEVDVWGAKTIGSAKFYVYASCRNWNKEVDRSVIDEEFGRTLQLIQTPHLRIFVAKRLTDPARETALADGFIVIELGEKASTDNAEEIYQIIYKHLRDLFVGIAPPELQRFAKEAREISDKLRKLAEEIEKVSR